MTTGASAGRGGCSYFPVMLVQGILKVQRATCDPLGPSLAVAYSVRYGKPVLTFRTGSRGHGGRCSPA
jgi:hypothetical protein